MSKCDTKAVLRSLSTLPNPVRTCFDRCMGSANGSQTKKLFSTLYRSRQDPVFYFNMFSVHDSSLVLSAFLACFRPEYFPRHLRLIACLQNLQCIGTGLCSPLSYFKFLINCIKTNSDIAFFSSLLWIWTDNFGTLAMLNTVCSMAFSVATKFHSSTVPLSHKPRSKDNVNKFSFLNPREQYLSSLPRLRSSLLLTIQKPSQPPPRS